MSRKKRKSKGQGDEILDYIKEKYGTDKIFKLPPKASKYQPEDFVSFGLYSLNEIVTGDYRCGPPRKRIVEIFGPESVGKTTTALSVSKETANNKQRVLYCDVEHGLNQYYASQMKINPEYFYYIQPDCAEEAFTMSEDLLKKFNFDLFVLDSVGGLTPRTVLEGNYDESNMGKSARLMSKAVRRLAPLLSKRNTAAIFINQLSSKIGGYGLKEDTAGGRKLKYYLWVRIEARTPRKGKILANLGRGRIGDVIEATDEEAKEAKKKKEKDSKTEVGILVNVKTVKNKLYAPQRFCKLKIIYGKGFDKEYDFLSYLDAKAIIKWGNKRLNYNGKSYDTRVFIEKYHKDKTFKDQIQKEIKERMDIPLIISKKGDGDDDE